MTLGIDPEVFVGMAALADVAGDTPPVGDVVTRRANSEVLFARIAAGSAPVPGVDRTDLTVAAADGFPVPLSWYSAPGQQPGSAVLYVHGGGMILGLDPLYDAIVRAYVAASGVPMLVVDYRIAPEHPHPTPVEDSYAGLRWLAGNAATLGVDPDRVSVMGDSAGGGLAAGVALLARDQGGPALAQQILIYPMLDDRTTTPDPRLPPEFLVWDYDDNVTGWTALLGPAAGGATVSEYAAPARAADVAGLPSTYIEVGDLDIFRDEDIDYARRLMAAGVPTELHVHPGCPHAFDAMAPDAAVTQRVVADRLRRLRSL
jgi:acetyl esterase/lipase